MLIGAWVLIMDNIAMLIKSSFGLNLSLLSLMVISVACDAVSAVALNFAFIKTNLKLRHGIILGLKEQQLSTIGY